MEGRKGKTYINELVQLVGPMQEVVNGLKIALAKNIRQLPHDGSSISSNTTLCCGILLTFNDGNEEKITLGASK